jgi:hypothetical protein
MEDGRSGYWPYSAFDNEHGGGAADVDMRPELTGEAR